MATRTAKHVTEAYRRAHEHLGKLTRDAIDASRASRSPARRLYGAGGPRGGPEEQRTAARAPSNRPTERGYVSPLGGQAK
jgi:hypothetical protein